MPKITRHLLRAKQYRPHLPPDLLPRPALFEWLQKRRARPLLLFSAPAGFGKTTLLAGWLDVCGWPSAWLSLDESDNDLALFLAYFLAAVRSIYPNFGGETEALINGVTLPPTPVLAATLSNELDGLEGHFVLALDEYELIHDPQIHDLLRELLRHPPRPLHLALTTRLDPPLPLASMRAKKQMVEIRAADLRLTAAETAVFLRQALPIDLSETAVAALAVRTEGWITGLRLMALSLRQQTNIDALLADPEIKNRYIMDYLLAEVLAQQPPEVQVCLMQTAVLDRFCASLCVALCQPSVERVSTEELSFDGQVFLHYLEEANLFLIPLDEHGEWFRFHPLLKELLRQRLKEQYSQSEIAALHGRAARWLSRYGLVEEAIHHALAAGETAVVIELVAQHRHKVLNQEDILRLKRWLRMLPEPMVEASAELLLLRAWTLHLQWRLPEIWSMLERVEGLLAQTPELATSGIRGEIDFFHSLRCYWTANSELGLSYGLRALAALPHDHAYARDVAWMFTAANQQMSGDLVGAYKTLNDSLQEAMSTTGRVPLRRLVATGFVQWTAADLPGLIETGRQLIGEAHKGGSPVSIGLAYYLLGCAYYQQNELAAAEAHFTYVRERRYQNITQAVVHSTYGLAFIRQAQGKPEQAKQLAEEIPTMLLEVQNAGQLPAAHVFQIELALRRGETAVATQWVKHADQHAPLLAMPLFYSPSMTLARALLALEKRDQAASYLARLRQFADSIHDTRSLIEVLCLQALGAEAQGEQMQARQLLTQAITLAAPSRLLRVFADCGPALAPILADVSNRGVLPDFVAQIQASMALSALSIGAGHGEQAGASEVHKSSAEMVEGLTNREMDVLLLLAQRLSNKEIAANLGITTQTAKGHTVHIYQKMGAHNRRQAVRQAQLIGILPLD